MRLVRQAELVLQQVAELGVDDSVDSVNVALVRARLRARSGDLLSAVRLAEEALSVARCPAHDGDQNVMSRLLVQSLADTADFRHSVGLPGVEALLTEALDVALQALGGNDPDTASVYNSVGMYCRYSGRLTEAEQAYGDALAVWAGLEDRAFAESQMAAVLHNLGSLRHLSGDLLSAERLVRDALDRRGGDELGRAADLAVLSAVLCDAGRLDEAAERYEQTRVLLTRQHSPDSPELAYLAANVAVLTHRVGDLDAADAQYQAALVATERALGVDHRQVGVILANQAQLAEQRQEHDRAAKLAGRAVRLLEADVACDGTLPALDLARRLAEPASSGGPLT